VSVWGSFALVSYVPDPLGSSLDGLRQSFPGSDPAHSHITILPPRPLHLPVERASEQATSILRKFQAFEVELEAVSTFPHTNVVYLDLSEGNRLVRELHQALNTGNLADNEQFEFHPHLTLGGPIAEAAVTPRRSAATQQGGYQSNILICASRTFFAAASERAAADTPTTPRSSVAVIASRGRNTRCRAALARGGTTR
jgi:2'-5' RNA ligase